MYTREIVENFLLVKCLSVCFRSVANEKLAEQYVGVAPSFCLCQHHHSNK